jgi:hypothetical protein
MTADEYRNDKELTIFPLLTEKILRTGVRMKQGEVWQIMLDPAVGAEIKW